MNLLRSHPHTTGATSRRLRPAVAALALALPLAAQAQTYSRTETISYYDDATHWVLGQVKRTTCVSASPASGCSGATISETAYDPYTALPIWTRAFGKLKLSATYNADGTLATITDGNGNTTSFSSWYRGIPRSIRFPATPEKPSGATRSATVSYEGWIASTTDEAGSITGYTYDDMGRVTRVDYPADTPSWAPTTSTYVQVGSSEHGIPAGHWKQTVTTGHGNKVTYFDAFWRPILVQEYDDTAETATSRYVATFYDVAGRLADVSYPLATAPTLGSTSWLLLGGRPNGVRTTYDTLDRPTKVVQDAEYPLTTLETNTAYLTGFKTQVTNPRFNVTTTGYLAWDKPGTDFPVSIAAPEGAYTDIARDAFGKPLSIKRRNSGGTISETRSFVYDGYQQLCKTIEPESGATVMAYDGAGNMQWSAAGLTLTGATSCDTGSVPAAEKATRQYDARNRLVTLSFPDGRGTQAWAYTPDGLPASIDTANDSPADIVTNTYTYNKRRLPTQETLAIPGQATMTIGYGYDANATLASIAYPDGTSVAYAPNALGQPTKAGPFALDVDYFPNGAMSGFVYGNGIVHTMQQNARGLPERSIDSGGVLDDSYDYDANGNVAGISDGLPGGAGDRTMTYDGLDRLTEAEAPAMYGAAGTHYSYDVLDNLTHVVAPGIGAQATRDYYYCYDGSWRLTNLKTGSCSGTTEVGLGYDVRGNLENKSGQHFVFDYGNRLRQATGLESYRYDGYGRRVSASSAAGTVYSFYGHDGVLRYQRDERQAKALDYVNLNGSLLARKSTALALPTTPATPTLGVQPGSDAGDYTVSWSTPAGATHYELDEQVGGGTWTVLQDGGTASASFSDKPSGTYGYQVRACAGAGTDKCSAYSAIATIVVGNPAAPSAPVVTAPATNSTGTYPVAWTASTGATHYELSEQVGSVWTALDDTVATSESISDRPDGSYGYRVRACNGSGTTNCSGYSPTAVVVVSHPLTVPTVPGLWVPPSNDTGSYTVNWSGAPYATHYELSEQVNGGAWSILMDANTLARAVSGKTDGSYGYRVRACDGVGTGACSDYSATATVVVAIPPPPPAVPTLNVTFTPIDDGTRPPKFEVDLTWTSSSGATSYELQRIGFTGLLYSGTDTDYQDIATGSAEYQVRACNAPTCSAWSSEVSSPPTPATPSLTVPPSSSTGAYTVDWGAVADATHYELSEQGSGGSWSILQDGSALSRNISGKADGNYGYRVRACNGSGTGNCSDYTATATITVTHPVAPDEPTLTLPVADADGTYDLAWSSTDSPERYELDEQVGTGSWSNGVYSGSALSKHYSGKAPQVYGYRIRACNGTLCSDDVTGTITVLGVPVISPLSSPNTTGDYTLTWSAVPGTPWYRVYESTDGGATWSGNLQNSPATTMAFADKPDGTYSYKVRACESGVCGDYSTVVAVTVSRKPSVPTLTLSGSTSTTGSYSASWTASTGATHYELTEQANGGSWSAPIQDTSALSNAISGKASGTYGYRVRACNGPGTTYCSNYSTTRTITVTLPVLPEQPTLTLAVADADGTYDVAWSSTDSPERYELDEQVGTGSWSNGVYSGSALSKHYSGKAPQVYGYRIRACNGTLCSDDVTGTITVLGVPVISPLSSPNTTGDYTLTWSAVPGTPWYRVYESTDGGATWSGNLQNSPATTMAFADKPDGAYSYKVRACESGVCGSYSAVISVTVSGPVTPSPPTLTVASSSGTGSYTVSWTSVSNATHYQLSEQVNGGSWSAPIQDTSALSKAISGKASGTYGYRVRACNGSGTSYCSNYSTTKTITVLPGVPTLTVPSSSGTGNYSVSWTSVSTATHYQLNEQVNGGGWTVIHDASGTSKAISGKANGSYGYRVRACNGSGTTYCGSYSVTKTITVSVATTAPGTPTLSGSASPIEGTKPLQYDVDLDWSAPAGSTYFELQRSGLSQLEYSGPDTDYSTVGSGTAVYQVRACNAVGCSGWSNSYSP